MVVPLTFALLGALTQAPSGVDSFSLEQDPIAFRLAVSGQERNEAWHCFVSGAVEILQIDGRTLTLRENAGVPGTVERHGKSEPVSYSFLEARGTILADGRVALTRRAEVRSLDDTRLFTFETEIELDLLGLGKEEPRVQVSRAAIVALEAKSSRLAKVTQLSVPVAPIVWTSPKSSVIWTLRGTTLQGRVILSRALSPEHFLVNGRLPADARIYVGGETLVLSAVAESTEDSTLLFTFELPKPVTLAMGELRLGGSESPYSVETAAPVVHEAGGAHASL